MRQRRRDWLIRSEAPTDGERRFWWSIIPVLTAVSIGKAVRLPNYKSAIQAQIDYRFGFVKRGMYGEIFTRPLHLEHYRRYAVFSWLMLALMVTVLLLLTWRSGLRERVLTGEAAALFFSSYSLTYMSHMVGYFEVDTRPADYGTVARSKRQMAVIVGPSSGRLCTDDS
jgi:hypothetical protein